MQNNEKLKKDQPENDSEESGIMENILESHFAMAILVSKLVKRENEILEECIACQARGGEHDNECEYKELLDFLKRINTLIDSSEEE